MHSRHTNKEQYFQEQVYTTSKYVIPFIEGHIPLSESTMVLEVGCGEGGNLKPFLDRGCYVTGIDLSASKIEHATNFFKDHPYRSKAVFIAKDIYLTENDLKDKFDLIILRDVIEHIHDQEKFMGFIRNFLKKEGVIFFGFPPWYNPFGGHQQICENKLLSKLPYFHLLPTFLYKMALKAGGEEKGKIEILVEIKETGISIERFEKILQNTEYKIVSRMHFFINPNYEIKFKLRPREQLQFITVIPFFRNFLITSSYYLVKQR